MHHQLTINATQLLGGKIAPGLERDMRSKTEPVHHPASRRNAKREQLAQLLLERPCDRFHQLGDGKVIVPIGNDTVVQAENASLPVDDEVVERVPHPLGVAAALRPAVHHDHKRFRRLTPERGKVRLGGGLLRELALRPAKKKIPTLQP